MMATRKVRAATWRKRAREWRKRAERADAAGACNYASLARDWETICNGMAGA